MVTPRPLAAAGLAAALLLAACGPVAHVDLDSPFDPANADLDFDGDGLTNGQERELGTDRLDPDTDADRLLDGEDLCPDGPASCIDPEELRGGGLGDGGDGGDDGAEAGADGGDGGGDTTSDGGEDPGPAGADGDGGGDDGAGQGVGGDGGGDDGTIEPGPGDEGGDGGGTGDVTGGGVDGGAGDLCEPTVELCNGVDDDCDGVVDQRCNGCDGDEQVPAGWVCVPDSGQGTVVLGSEEVEDGRSDDERQRHVRITRSFFIQVTEVTREDWAERMLPREFSDAGELGGLPVDGVSWFDALTYANALSRHEGLQPCYDLGGCRVEQGGILDCADWEWRDGLQCEGYRLPTEAEWELAARAGEKFEAARAREQAWCGEVDDPVAPGPDRVRPVRDLPANAWGLHDMLGNVAEWVFDAYLRHPSPTSVDPFERGGVQDPRVLRGGAVREPWSSCRTAARSSAAPDDAAEARGFRLVRTAL